VLINPPLSARYENHDKHPKNIGEVYQNGQYAVGYTFWSAGLVRVQYIGGTAGRETSPGTGTYYKTLVDIIAASNYAGLANPLSFQAAFTYWGVENLTAEIGVTYPLPIKDRDGFLQRPLKVYLSAEYSIDDFNIKGSVNSSFLGKEQHDKSQAPYYNGFDIGGGITPSYNFGFATLGGDLLAGYKASDKFNNQTVSDTETLHLGAGVWIEKSFANGGIKAGFACTVPLKNAPLIITLPVVFYYWI
jgi:hypothetical protein